MIVYMIAFIGVYGISTVWQRWLRRTTAGVESFFKTDNRCGYVCVSTTICFTKKTDHLKFILSYDFYGFLTKYLCISLYKRMFAEN